MNKELFLLQLERLLYDIPKEERDEAMDYYRSYFEDAGAENEAVVLEELESPQIIADSIKEALNSTGDMAGGLKNPPQVRGGRYKSIFSGSDFQKKPGQDPSSDGNRQANGSAYREGSGGAAYRRYDQYEDKGRQAYGASDRRSKLILLIILAVLTAPVWGTALSGVLGVAGVIIAAVVVLGVCSVGGVIGGIVCTIVAVVKLCTFSLVRGLLMLGIGMLLTAGGGISIVLLLLMCGRFLPWAVRQIVQLFRRVLQWGRSAA